VKRESAFSELWNATMGTTDRKFFDVIYRHCGKSWEMTVDTVGTDACPNCEEEVEPVYYYETPEENIPNDSDAWEDDDDADYNSLNWRS
jgi:hypothetical protein